MNKWITDNLWRHVVGVLVAFFALFPLYLVIISSINPTGSLQVSSFIPTEFSLKNYQQLFNDPTIPYLVWMKNTLLISGAVAILSVIIGASSAFAFSRLRFKGKKFGIQLLFLVQMFPAILALSAVYVIMERVYNFAPGYGLGTQPLVEDLVNRLPKNLGHKIWMSRGTSGLDAKYEKCQELADQLMIKAEWQVNKNFKSVIFNRASHNERAWARQLPEALEFWIKN